MAGGGWFGGWFGGVSSGDTTPPSPAPTGAVTARAADGFTVTLSNTGETGATRKLEVRERGSTDAWTLAASTTTVAAGQTLAASGLSAGWYEWQLVDEDASSNRTTTGARGAILLGSSTWATILALVRSVLVDDLGVDTTDIYDGERPQANYADAAYTLIPQAESVAEQANGGLVLREYPVEVEYRSTVQEQDGADRLAAVRAAHDALIDAFDNATPSDLPTLPALERARVDVRAKTENRGEFARETVSRLTIVFPIWETR